MSSHDHDQLLVEGAAAGDAGSGRSAARGTRRASTPTEEKAAGRVPTQRTRTSKQATATSVAATSTSSATRAKTTGAKAPAAKAPAAKKTTPKTAIAAKATAATTAAKSAAKTVAKSAGTKATAAKAASAKAKAAKAPAAKPAAAKPAAKPAAKAPAAKAAAAKTPAAKPPARKPAADSAETPTPPRPRPRPTPRPRPAAAAVVEPLPAPALTLEEPRPVAMAERLRTVTRRVPPSLRRLTHLRAPSPRRRPAVFLAALLAGGLAVGVISAGGTQAQAAGQNSSVSVARELGVSSQRQLLARDSAPRPLQDLVATRAQRDAAQTAAAQTQQQAVTAATEAARPKAVLPVPPGYRLTTCFCMRWGVMHEGIDLAEPMGTPEYAAMDGVVLKAGPASGFGQAVYIQHQNGDVTIYGHMEKILVQEGQVVHAGDTIALMGAEGQSTGPHLHFEVHLGGIDGPKTDPIPWLAARGVIV